MTYLVYIFFFFCLMLLKTTILPAFFGSVNVYDLLIIFIIYIGFFRSLLESFPVVLVLGLVMDCYSGGAFGIYTTTYLWLYAVVTLVIQYLHVDSRFLLPAAIVVGVLWENIVILITVTIKNGYASFPTVFIKIVLIQIIWAVITGPVIFFVIKYFHIIFEELFQKALDRNSQKSDFGN